MRAHVETRVVYVPLRSEWFVPVLDVPRIGAIVGPPLPSKSLAKKAIALIRKEVKP